MSIPLPYKQSNKSNSTQHFIISRPIDLNPTWKPNSYQFHTPFNSQTYFLPSTHLCTHT